MELEKKVFMLTTTTCSKCPFVKQMLSTKDVEVEYINNDNDPTIASELEIFSVPSIIDNRDGKETQFIGQESCMLFVNSL